MMSIFLVHAFSIPLTMRYIQTKKLAFSVATMEDTVWSVDCLQDLLYRESILTQYFLLAPFARSYRVADEALIAETVVYGPSSFFLINFFFAVQGSKPSYSYSEVLHYVNFK